MDSFATAKIDVGETKLFVRHAGCDPPLVLLHGFPQSRRMWRRVAPAVVQRFAVVCPELRGDGDNGCPPSDWAHAHYTKRSIYGISGAPI